MKPTTIPQQRYLDRITSRILILAENMEALPPGYDRSNLIKACGVLDEVIHSQIFVKE